MMQQRPPASNPQAAAAAQQPAVNRNDRIFKRGTLMFIEGESGREMYILRKGKVRILKQEGDRAVQLAVLGPGSVLGELSLLDNQPRGATGQVTEDVVATVIDQVIFEDTLSKVPSWLVAVIKTVVSRLRETNRRNGDDIVKNHTVGVVHVLLLLQRMRLAKLDEHTVVPIDRLKEEAFSITGISAGDVERVLLVLIVKNWVLLIQDERGKDYVRVTNPIGLQMYMTYLRVRLRGGRMVGEGLSERAVSLAQVLLDAAVKSGHKQPDGRTVVGTPQVELEIQRSGGMRYMDPNALHELEAAKLVESVKGASASAGSVAKGSLCFNDDRLKRAILLRSFIPAFQEEVIL